MSVPEESPPPPQAGRAAACAVNSNATSNRILGFLVFFKRSDPVKRSVYFHAADGPVMVNA
jgi:hypothetical protein